MDSRLRGNDREGAKSGVQGVRRIGRRGFGCSEWVDLVARSFAGGVRRFLNGNGFATLAR